MVYRNLAILVQLILVGVFFASSANAQAIVPDPASIAPVINPPNPQTNIVISLSDFLKPGVTTYQAFKQAVDACRQQHAAKLVIPTGRYVFDDPQILQDHAHVFFGAGNTDLIIDGQGSELVFHYALMGVNIDVAQRLVLRNLIIDYDFQIASPGKVQKESDGRTSIRILDDYPVNQNTFIHIVSPYDFANSKWKAVPGEVYDVQNPTVIRPQTIVSPAFDSLPDGEDVVLVYANYQGPALGVFNSFPDVFPTADISLENITVYSAPGFSFSIRGGRGFRLSNCRIMQRPGANRLISSQGDGLNITNTLGDILVENCDFSGMGDDSVNIHANMLPVTQKTSARTVVLASQSCGCVRAGAVLKFMSADTLTEYARLNVIQVSFDQSTGRYTVTVDQDLPETLSVNDLAVNLTQSNPRLLLRGNYFHDHRAIGMKIHSANAVIENNRVKDTTWSQLLLYVALPESEGPGPESVIVRNNTFDGGSYGNYGNSGSMAPVNIFAQTPAQAVASAPASKNILFEANTISRTPGLALFISSSSGITVSNNVIINSNTLGAFPISYGSAIGVVPHGSVMVTKASNVLLTGNLQLTTPQQTEKGLFIDQQTTSGITSQGYYIDPLPANVIDDSRFYVRQNYLDLLGRFSDLAEWDNSNSQIIQCGADLGCINTKRADVSTAVYLSMFQNWGYLLERVYKTAYGNATGASTFGGSHTFAVPSVRFSEFLPDSQELSNGVKIEQTGWEAVLENNKQTFLNEFVQRSRFTTAFPTTMTPAQFVDQLNANAGNVLSASERTTAINLFGAATNTIDTTARAQALRQVAEDQDLSNAEFNRAFVLLEFFSYLRRNPNDLPDADYSHYDSLLTRLNQFNGDYASAAMISIFITLTEYQERFGPATAPMPPTIFVEENTNRVATLNSVTFVRGPFALADNFNFSSDHRTRVMLFTNVAMIQSDSSLLTVRIGGLNATVESVGPIFGVSGMDASYVVVRLPDGLPSGDLPLTLTLRGVPSSNAPILNISP